MEPTLSLAQEQQAIGRLHRVGQALPVRVTRYVLKETVDEKVLTMHQRGERNRARDADSTGQQSLASFFEPQASSSAASAAPAPSSDSGSAGGPALQQALDLPTLRRLLE